jgi:hypothetical protein
MFYNTIKTFEIVIYYISKVLKNFMKIIIQKRVEFF